PPWRDLTPRELEVLTHVARGRSNQEIARELVLSEATVRTHMANILSKLHLADRTQAAIYALQQRLVSLDDTGEGKSRWSALSPQGSDSARPFSWQPRCVEASPCNMLV